MFCARCGTQVGAHDAVCPQCGLNLRLPGAVRMTDPGSCDETRVQSPVSEGATPTREIPRVQTPSEPVEWQDSMPTQQWQVQDSTPTQQWTTNSQSGSQQPSQGQYRDLGASQMPDDWFRDPEAERTRVMAAVPENPVFTPPPPPSTPAMAYPPPPSGDSSRHRKVLIGLVVGLLVLVVLGAVLLFAGGLKGRSGSEPAVVATPSASSQPKQSASEDPQATSIDTTPSFLMSSPASPSPVPSSPASSSPALSTPTPLSPQSPTLSARQVADKLPDGDTLCSSSVGAVGTTSCPFALEVANAIPAGAQGDYEVQAYSPVTGKTYTMKCETQESYTTCTGGIAAKVHILR